MHTKDLIDLFKAVLEDAHSSGCNMELRDGEKRVTVQSLCSDTLGNIEKAMKSDLTQILIVPFILEALRYLPSLYFVSLEEYLAGTAEEKFERYRQLTEAISGSEVLRKWTQAYQDITRTIAQIGMQPDEALVKDLPRIAKVFLDAFTYLDEHKRIKVRSGRDSYEKPVLLHSIPEFASLGEMFDRLCGINQESCVLFSVISPTFLQTTDPIDAWAGRESEVLYNARRNKRDFDPKAERNLSESRVVIGIKRGENIWLIEDKSPIARAGCFVEYGTRQSYLPYQVLFEKAPVADCFCTALAIPNKSWTVDKIVDPEQAVWFPGFLWAVERAFYQSSLAEDEPVVLLRDSVRMVGGKQVNQNLPVVQARLTACPDVMQVPAGYKTSPDVGKLLKWLEITGDEIKDLLITPVLQHGSAEDYERHMWHRSRYALMLIAEKHLREIWTENHKELENWFRERCTTNVEFIYKQLGIAGSPVDALAVHRVNGKKLYNQDGSPLMDYRDFGRERQATEKTYIDDGRPYHEDLRVLVCRPATLFGKKPPVAVTIAASKAVDLAFLAGLPLEDMPWQYQIWGLFSNRSSMDYSRLHAGRDPMLYLHNPFSGSHRVSVCFAISKAEYRNLRNSRTGGLL